MRFTCEKNALVTALNIASRTVAQKSSLSVIEGILCTAGMRLSLTGYNMETAITYEVDAEISDPGQCVLPSKLFGDIVRRLPEGPVTVVVDEKYKVSIRAGFASFTIAAEPADDYPELPDVGEGRGVRIPQNALKRMISKYKVSIRAGFASFTIAAEPADDYPELPDVGEGRGVRIPQNALKRMISGTIFAVSENQSRPIHTGVRFEVEDTAISAIAVDGFRLARRTFHPEQPTGRTMAFVVPAQALKARRTFHPEQPTGRTMAFVVPAQALKEVEKILSDTEDHAEFTLGTRHILFQVAGATLVCRLLDGEFLDWKRVVPTNCPVKLVANVADLSSSIERVGLIVSEKFKSPVRCVFSNQNLLLRTNTTIGAAEDQCAIAGDGNEMEIGFNVRYLADALKAVPSEEVTLELTNGLSPIVLTPVDEKEDFAYMVLPVRLKNS